LIAEKETQLLMGYTGEIALEVRKDDQHLDSCPMLEHIDDEE
jgi:hypothetical protein